jgi:hypothetical protein
MSDNIAKSRLYLNRRVARHGIARAPLDSSATRLGNGAHGFLHGVTCGEDRTMI